MTQFLFDVSPATALTVGQAAAPNELVAIFNLGCPDTLLWWDNNQAELLAAVAGGQLQAHFKFWSKPKDGLKNGNVAHRYLDYQRPSAALAFMRAVFADQAALRALDEAQVAQYVETQFGVSPYLHAQDVQVSVDHDVAHNDVATVPTLILNDVKYTGDTLPHLQAALQ